MAKDEEGVAAAATPALPNIGDKAVVLPVAGRTVMNTETGAVIDAATTVTINTRYRRLLVDGDLTLKV